MSTQKVAVTIPADLLEQAQAAVAAGRARSLSAYISQAIRQYQREQTLTDFLAAWAAESGEPSVDDYDWAKSALE